MSFAVGKSSLEIDNNLLCIEWKFYEGGWNNCNVNGKAAATFGMLRSTLNGWENAHVDERKLRDESLNFIDT